MNFREVGDCLYEYLKQIGDNESATITVSKEVIEGALDVICEYGAEFGC